MLTSIEVGSRGVDSAIGSVKGTSGNGGTTVKVALRTGGTTKGPPYPLCLDEGFPWEHEKRTFDTT